MYVASCRARSDGVRPSGRSAVARLPQRSTQAGHRHRQHAAEAAAEAAGAFPLPQKRSLYPPVAF